MTVIGRRSMVAALAALALVTAGCASTNVATDVEEGAAETSTTTTTTTVETTTTAPEPTTTTSSPTTIEAPPAIVAGKDPEVDAVVEAYRTAFDSTMDFESKAPFIEDSDSLADTIAAYQAAGAALGGIKLEPKSVEIDGTAATVTYDVLFADAVAYADLTGEAVNVDGQWLVTKDQFCGFMATARTPCP